MKHYPFYIFLFSQNSYQIAIFLYRIGSLEAFRLSWIFLCRILHFVDLHERSADVCSRKLEFYYVFNLTTKYLYRFRRLFYFFIESHPIYKVQTYHPLLHKAGNIRSTLPDLQPLWTTHRSYCFLICCIFSIIFRSSMNCVDIFQSQFFDHSIQELNSFVELIKQCHFQIWKCDLKRYTVILPQSISIT